MLATGAIRLAVVVLYYGLANAYDPSVTNITDSPVVDIANYGMARGYQYHLQGKAVNIFHGIPFARPPMGSLRFAPPDITPRPWKGIKNFTEPSPWCIQPLNGYANDSNTVFDEDCLYLNIYTPGNATSTSKLAVMVWIHGGSFVSGSGYGYDGDGSMLATRQQIIVVTVNYRLGVLGFFNIPGTSTSGNYGLLDQIAALKWVRSNIEQFGGNPAMVTIVGESAGSVSVSLQVLSPLSRGLFKRAISQSGTANAIWAVSPPGLTNSSAKAFGANIGCKDLNKLTECLRSKSSKDILSHQNRLTPLTMPNVDNHFLTAHPWKMIAKNKFDKLPLNDVDYLLGFNLDEGTLFAPSPPQSKRQFEQTIVDGTQMRYPGRNRDKFYSAVSYKYTDWTAKGNTPLRWFNSISNLITDSSFNMPSIEFANAWTLANKTAYVYLFSHALKYPTSPLWGVTHASEIAFIFGKPFYPPKHPGGIGFIAVNFTEADRKVSHNMMEMWAGFVKNGSPGFGWPRYTIANKEYLNIALKNKVEKNWKPDVMAFWTDLVPKLANASAALSIALLPSTCKPKAGSGSFGVHPEMKLWKLVFIMFLLNAVFSIA